MRVKGWGVVLSVCLLGWMGCEPASDAPSPGAQAAEEMLVEEPGERDQEEALMAPTPEVEGPAGELAAKVYEAHGGPRWPQVKELGFRFVVKAGEEERFAATHDWKVWDGEDRVQWTDNEGQAWDVTVDLASREASEATLDGTPVEGEPLKAAGEAAYQRWVNDAYWLLMPIKVFDPGVSLEYGGEVGEEGQRRQVLELSFEGVGLTPGDRYEVQVDPQTGEVRAWTMHLQGDRPPSTVLWGGYEELGPLRLPLERTWEGGERQIVFDTLRVQ
ncbi:hypothetical protein DL240_10855 [Lujinxingia litoralis]|uniref:Uncharacterized protein n=1 Tax=Lujinxingia litoralis TaxID=2211119 RepID=A0A328C7G1_9DELT|nr:hypothetical protein [Lujinxingia litoralis]RAL22340.1 hypothetical protein DL240_10855 [Lujinxingia litoralis]